MDMNLGEHYSVPLQLALCLPKITFNPQAKHFHPNPTFPKVLTHSSTNSKSEVSSKYHQLKKLGQKVPNLTI